MNLKSKGGAKDRKVLQAPREQSAAVRLSVRAQPGASRSQVIGPMDNADGNTSWKIAVAAPPVDGAANAELLVVLARALKVPRSALVLARGESSKNKLVDVLGLDAATVTQRLHEAARK